MIHSKRLVEGELLFIKLNVTEYRLNKHLLSGHIQALLESVKPRYRSAFVSPFSVVLADCATKKCKVFGVCNIFLMYTCPPIKAIIQKVLGIY